MVFFFANLLDIACACVYLYCVVCIRLAAFVWRCVRFFFALGEENTEIAYPERRQPRVVRVQRRSVFFLYVYTRRKPVLRDENCRARPAWSPSWVGASSMILLLCRRGVYTGGTCLFIAVGGGHSPACTHLRGVQRVIFRGTR